MNDIQTFAEDVQEILRSWLAIHTDRKTWFTAWTEDSDYIPDTLNNSYFDFDVIKAAYKYLAQDIIDNDELVRCANCNMILVNGEDCEDCENCTDFDSLDIADILDYVTDCGFEPNEHHKRDAVYNEGFDAYQNGIYDAIEGIIEEITYNLDQLSNAVDAYEFLAALLQATQIYHTCGNIMDDYGNLDYATLDNFRNVGFIATFGEDVVNDFINNF